MIPSKRTGNPVIITCPRCRIRYQTPAGAIGAKRRVRCSSCQHLWLEYGSSNTLPPTSTPTEAAASHGTRQRRRAPAFISAHLWWSSILVVLCGVFTYTLINSNTLGQIIPHLQHLQNFFFSAPHKNAKTSSCHFTIQRLSLKGKSHASGTYRYRVTGLVKNNTNQIQQLPPLRVKLFKPRTHETDAKILYFSKQPFVCIKEIPVTLKQESLLPSEAISFDHTFEGPASKTAVASAAF